jgi:hypothetical protein
MKHKDGKLINQPNKNRSLTAAITIILLCGLSFYLGGVFKSGNSGGVDVINTIQKTLDSPKQSSGSFQIRPVNFSMHRSKGINSLILIVLRNFSMLFCFFLEENCFVMLIEF